MEHWCFSCTRHACAKMCTAPSSTLTAQPNNPDLSLQASERRVQELEEIVAACRTQIESLAAEKLQAQREHVAEYNALATE